MMLFFSIIGYFLLFCLVYHLLTKRYLNPYKLTFIFGDKGMGKTTLMTKLAVQYYLDGKDRWFKKLADKWSEQQKFPKLCALCYRLQPQPITVYCTEEIPYTYKIDHSDIGTAEFEPYSVVLIDEAGMKWDNRDFKSFGTQVRDWFKLQRHRKIKVFMLSQTFDVDKKIRDLVDNYYLIERRFRIWSYAKRINKKTSIVEATAEAPSKVVTNLYFDSLFFFWCGSRKLTFIPRYVKYFDSYEAAKLEEKEFVLTPAPPIGRASFLESLRLRLGLSS